MNARIHDGWLIIPYAGHDLARVYIGVGNRTAETWTPAFLDWVGGLRVAKIRQPEPTGSAVKVWLKVNSTIASAGAVVPR